MSRVRTQLDIFYADLGWHVVTHLDKLLSKGGHVYLARLADSTAGTPSKRKVFERGLIGLLGRECPDLMKLIPAPRRARFMAGTWEAIKDGRLPQAVQRWRGVPEGPGRVRRAVRPRPRLDVGYARDRRVLLARRRAKTQARRTS